jgi:hypothetical protein
MIQNATDLQTAIVEWLARDQDTVLIARVPTFIQLFEAKMNRDLFTRQMETRVQAITDPALTSDPEYVALPPDFQTMRRIRMTSDTGKSPLDYVTPVQMDEMRYERQDTPGRPRKFTIFGNEIELFPTPGIAVTLEMIYRQNLPSLNANASNWLLALAPDAYLYGSLMESAPYIKEDSRIAVWGAGMTSALTDLNNLGSNSAFNAGPLQVRVSGGHNGNFRR